ncbi:MAG TPA: hypothetical protein DD435_15680 [Cyanobacteria bacterium UBA8530]|nr:hypothetical protein [Cyanobacteria bacterium UBA8530]
MTRSLFSAKFLRFFFKSRCGACSHWGESGLCPFCLSRFERMKEEACPTCLRKSCECVEHPPSYARLLALGYYRGALRDSIRRFKFHGRADLALDFGALLASFEVPDGIVVPVPLAPDRLAKRGYNQSELLARVFAQKKGLPFRNLLRRRIETLPQFSLRKRERWENLSDAFEIFESPRGKRILLLDDIFTSGATAHWASETLLAAGAPEVWVLVLARAKPYEP